MQEMGHVVCSVQTTLVLTKRLSPSRGHLMYRLSSQGLGIIGVLGIVQDPLVLQDSYY